MSQSATPPFSLMANPTFEAEAKKFANALVEKFHKQHATHKHLNSICIDFFDDFPEDKVLERVITILNATWTVEPREFTATSGRAGCIWMTPKFPIS